jgi:hypothetical protein
MYATWTLIDSEVLDGSPEGAIVELGGTCEILYSTVVSGAAYVLGKITGETFETNLSNQLEPWGFTVVSAETAYNFIDSTFSEIPNNPRAVPGVVEPTKAEMLGLIPDWPA